MVLYICPYQGTGWSTAPPSSLVNFPPRDGSHPYRPDGTPFQTGHSRQSSLSVNAGILRTRLIWAIAFAVLVCAETLVPSATLRAAEAAAAVTFTREETAWLKSHPVIRHAPDPDYAPLESQNSGLEPVGLAPDLLKLIADRLGVEFRTVNTSSWAESQELLRNREADFVSVATRTDKRSEYMLFTSPYIHLPDVIIVRNTSPKDLTMDDLAGKTISTIAGWGANDYIRESYPEINMKLVSSVETALRDVSFGTVDATVFGLATASYWIEKTKITNLRVGGQTGYEYHLAFGSRKDWPILNQLFEKALGSINLEERQAIERKWISLNAPGWEPGPVTWILGFLILFIVPMVTMLFWNRSLRATVEIRTRDIQAELAARELVERELRTSEQLLNEAQILAHLGHWTLNLETEEITGSEELFRIFGLSRDETDLNSFIEVIHLEDRGFVLSHIKRGIEKGENWDIEYRLVCRDGSEKYVNAKSEAVADDSGKVVLLMGTVQDITERNRAEEKIKFQEKQLIQADKMASLGILISGVAHEINNPTNFITFNAPILANIWSDALPILKHHQEENGDFSLASMPFDKAVDTVPKLLSGLSSGGERIKKIVINLKKFARNNLTEGFQPVNLNAVLKSSVMLLSNEINKSTNNFSVENGADLPRVMGDFQKIEQVLINLITNACQALPDAEKAIRVKTDYDTNSAIVRLTVTDEGVGISPKDLASIIDPFFTTKRDSGGTGLGLSVSYNIIKEHGGNLEFSSTEGEGTTAVISFPGIH